MKTRSLLNTCRRYALAFAIASGSASFSLASLAADATFAGSTLSLPEVNVSGKFYNATLLLTNASPLEFTLATATVLSTGNAGTASTFGAGALTIPRVVVNGKTYSAQLALISSTPLAFRLTSATLLGGGTGGGTTSGSITNVGNGNCVNVPYPPINVVAAYKTIPATGGTIDYTEEFLEVSDALMRTRTITTQTVSGITINSTALFRTNFVVSNDLRYLSSNFTEATASGFTTQATSTYTPAYLTGPLHRVCEQQAWDGGNVVVQFTAQVGGTSTNIHLQTNIESVSTSVTVPGGTFNTVQSRHFDNITKEFSRSWLDVSSGRLIKSQNYNAAAQLVSTIEFQGLR